MWLKEYEPAHPRRFFAMTALCAATLSLGACAADGPVQPKSANGSPAPAPAPPAPTVVSVAVVPDSVRIGLGESLTLRAVKVMSNGTRVDVPGLSLESTSIPPHYTAFPNEILAINGVTGIAVGVGAGLTRVRVEVDGLVGFGTVTVTGPSSSGPSAAMSVDAFSMVEYQYASPSGERFYAPQLRVSAKPSRSITVLTLQFEIPGLDNPIPGWGCGARVVAGTPREMNGELYGDWTFTMDEPGHQASGAAATAVISFIDDTGALGSLTVRGPVIAGNLPATYTGGPNGGGCFHGYGSTG